MSEILEPKIVESVTDFLSCIIKGTEKEQLSFNFYYRGERGRFPYRLPNLYREKTLVRYGAGDYYRSMINELGRNVYNDSQPFVQLLSELQHYGARTRMLDITSNPLVALFFATAEHCGESEKTDEDHDGYIYIFKEEKGKETYDTDQDIVIKSALNMISQQEINTFLLIMEQLSYMLADDDELAAYRIGEGYVRDNANIDKILRIFGEYDELPIRYREENNKLYFWDIEMESLLNEEDYYHFNSVYRDVWNNFEDECEVKDRLMDTVKDMCKAIIQRFLQNVQKIARLSEPIECPMRVFYMLQESQIVLASKSTNRMKQQQGSFIYPCFTTVFEDMASVERSIHESIQAKQGELSLDRQRYHCIKIPKNKKREIRKELYLIGINQGVLFPDIENHSIALLNQFDEI